MTIQQLATATSRSAHLANPALNREIQNIKHRIANLMIKMLDVVSKMSERDRENTSSLKATFRKATTEIYQLHIRIGYAAPWIAGTSMLASSSQFFAAKEMAPVIQFVSSQIPSFANIYPSGLQATEASLQAQQSVRLSEITALSQKQSDAELKQSITELFRLVCEAERSASR